MIFENILFFFNFFWPCHMACGIFISLPEIKPVPLALEAQSLNPCTARKIQKYIFNEVNSLTSTPPTSSTQATTGNNLNIHPSFWVFPWLCRSLYFVSINIKYFLIHTHKEGLCKYFWLAVCNKVPKVRRIKTTEINLLTVLKARSRRSRCQKIWLLLRPLLARGGYFFTVFSHTFSSRHTRWEREWKISGVSSSSDKDIQFSSVQSLSRVWLCDPTNRITPGLPVHHQLPEFTQTHVYQVGDAIQPSLPLSSPSSPALVLLN